MLKKVFHMKVNFKFRALKPKTKNKALQTGSIQGRVHFEDSTVFSTFPTKQFCKYADWNAEKQCFRKDAKKNEILNRFRTELSELWHELLADRKRQLSKGIVLPELTPKELIEAFNPKKTNKPEQAEKVYLMQDLIADFLKDSDQKFKNGEFALRVGLLKMSSSNESNKAFALILLKFLANKEIEPKNFRFTIIKEFKSFAKNEGYAESSINSWLSKIGEMFKFALKSEKIEFMPFVEVPKFHVVAKHIENPLDKLQKIMNLQFAKKNLIIALDLFKLQVFTGFSFDDVVYDKHRSDNFDPKLHRIEKNGLVFLIKNRGKTNEKYLSFVYPEAQAIFDKYQNHFPKMNYPAYRLNLQRISKVLGFKLTSHDSRKLCGTFLTELKEVKDMKTIKMALGHNPNTTITNEVYFDDSNLRINSLIANLQNS